MPWNLAAVGFRLRREPVDDRRRLGAKKLEMVLSMPHPSARAVRLSYALLLLMLSACGGGGGSTATGSNPNCEPCVLSGFRGDLDWELLRAPGTDFSDGEGGIGGGGDGEGGVGAGGSLGQFRGALVIARFPDGREIGQALTDDVAGMVTIRPGRDYRGPLLVEIHGQPGATYFEEGKNVSVPFEPGRVLRAVVPVISRNIGITPFSEAGYQLAVRCQTGDGPVEVCGAPAPGGNTTVPAPATIQAANAHVTGILNQQIPNSLKVDDVTRLPFIVGENTPDDTIVDTPRGRYGLANIAFSKQAAMFNAAAAAPTLLATEQLSRDLLDGRLDGVSIGAPSAPAASRTYDPQTLTSEMSAALAQQTTRYGNAATRGLLPVITAFGNTRYDSYYFDATLEPSGATSTIAVATESASDRRAPGQRTTWVGPGRTDSRGFMLYGNMGSGALFIKTDSADSTSSILAVGDNRNGELGDGSQTSTGPAGPARLTLPGVLTHAAGGIAHTVVRLADGSVWAWGDNSLGQLGQGQNGAALPASRQPLRVPLPAGALSVVAANQSSFALLEDGSVWSWGNGWGFGTLGDGTAAGERVSPAPVLSTGGPLGGVVQLAARDNDAIALTADGTVWTWGSFASSSTSETLTGITPGRLVATRTEGLPATGGGVRKVLTEQGLFAVLLAGSTAAGEDLDGAVYAWGIHFDITANKVLRDLTPVRVLNLPPARDLMPGGFLGYGQRPSDRLTGMAIDYDGLMWKVRGRVAESYDPKNPTAQRRPQGQPPREDCASCHVIRPKTLPPVPTSGPICAVPPAHLALLTTDSTCESCHNGAPLAGGRVLGGLNCAPPVLPPPPALIRTPIRTNQCALPVAHPIIKANAACSSCHNSVVTTPLTCSPDLVPLEPPSTIIATILRAIDDVGPIVSTNLPSGSVTDDPTPTLVGSLSAPLAAGEFVTVLSSGLALGQAQAGTGATSFDFTPASPLAFGATYLFSARIDRNGASSGTAGNTFSLTVSNEGPDKTAQITQILDDVLPVRGNVAGGSSNDIAPLLSGTVSPGLVGAEAVRVRRNGSNGTQAFFEAQVVSPTSWQLQQSGLANGVTYTYAAQATGPGGAGAFGTPVSVTIDTAAPTARPTISVRTDTPAILVRENAAVRASGLGLSDTTPELRASVTGAAGGDQIELLVSFDGGATYSRAAGTALQPVGGSGTASTAQTVTLTGPAAAAVGSASQTPGGAAVEVRFRARLVDAAGNLGPPSPESVHRVGLFGCLPLKSAFYPSHFASSDANAPGSCAGSGCHAQTNSFASIIQRMPGALSVPAPSTSYWCTFSTANAVRVQ